MKRILVGIDGSEGSARAARWAAELAKRTGATIELIDVYDEPPAIEADDPNAPERELGSGSTIAAFVAAEQAVAGLASAEQYFVAGQPAAEIVARAEATDADLIVLGSLGLRSLEGVMLGSVARVVLERAGRPVAVVP